MCNNLYGEFVSVVSLILTVSTVFFCLHKISVDVTEVEFGSQVLGETRKRIINVTNNGALGTQFIFRKITGIDFISLI